MSTLFSPLRLRDLTLRNRIVVAPMCQYSAFDGVPQPWHWQHLGSMAVSGAGLVIAEATAVVPEGRISPSDTGLWNQAQECAWADLIAGIRTYCDTPVGIQLAHAGRKASTAEPWADGPVSLSEDDRGWRTVAPSALPFRPDWHTPGALDAAGMDRVVEGFVAAAGRALRAGFDLVELHAAHGYLLTEFLSPLSNRREDEYGGSLENRMRFPLRVAAALREAWPKALGARFNGSDWADGGITPDEAATFAGELAGLGYDYGHVSSGGNIAEARIPGAEPGYQVEFAARVKAAVPGLPILAVGMIVTPEQAEAIVASGQADGVALARAILDDPRWPWHAAATLGVEPRAARQYARALHGSWPGYGLAHG